MAAGNHKTQNTKIAALIAFLVFFLSGCAGGAEQVDGVAKFEAEMAALNVEQSIIECMVKLGGLQIELDLVSATEAGELRQSCEFSKTAAAERAAKLMEQTESKDQTEPHAFGDDIGLDGLWTQCESGKGQACDALFEQAPVGSEYEAFGVSCGNTPGVVNCVDLNEQSTPPVPSVYKEMMADIEAKAKAANAAVEVEVLPN